MKIWIVLLTAFVVGSSAQNCSCETMKWASCEATPCSCYLLMGDNVTQTLKCDALIPKCFVMKAEMYRARKGLSTRTGGGKPDETAIVDNDGIYDPDCEADGKFKAKQCNNAEKCWCVNSAGVRRTDKGDKNLKCEKLVETYSARISLTLKAKVKLTKTGNLKVVTADAIHKVFNNLTNDMVASVTYYPKTHEIAVDVKKEKGDYRTDLINMVNYLEKNVNMEPLIRNQDKFAVTVEGQKLEFEKMMVFYEDEEPPTFTMEIKNLSDGITAVLVMLLLIVVVLIIVGVVIYRRKNNL